MSDTALFDYVSQFNADEIKRALDREFYEASLWEFYKAAWSSFDPSPLVEGWHLRAIAEHLEAVTCGEIRKLLINVPPRFSKPVAHDALVLTKDRGLIPLRDVTVGLLVWTHLGRWRSVLEVIPQGILESVTLTTTRGRKVCAAPDHLFLTPDGWAEVGSLSPDDVVAVVPCRDQAGAKTIKNEEARLLGYLVGDGCVQGTPNVTCGDDESAADIVHCVEACGFTANEQKYKIQSKGGWLRRISIKGECAKEEGRTKKGYLGPVKRWINKHNLQNKSSYTKMVPQAILEGDNEIVAEFLGAYWACDGHIVTKGAKRDGSLRTDLYIGCDSVNRDLMAQIQILLGRLGIQSYLRKKVVNLVTKRQGSTYTSYSLGISSQDDCWRFAKQIRLRHSKMSRISNSFARRFDFDRALWGETVFSVEQAEPVECFCLRVEEDSSFTANGFAVHNTSMVSIAWPCWTWALEPRRGDVLRGPGVRLLCASYGAGKAEIDANAARNLLASSWYQSLWGDRVRISKNMDSRGQYDTTAGGSRISTGIPESLGKGGVIRTIDDPSKTDEAESEVMRDAVIRNYREIWSTRSNDPTKGAEVVIMQRIAANDLSGYLLDQGGWTHLCLPARYEPARHCTTSIGWSDPRSVEGESLWPEMYSDKALRKLEREVGPHAWAGQFQQSPQPRGGGIIKTDWWQLWPPDNEAEAWTSHTFDENGEPVQRVRNPAFEFVLLSLDTAYTEKEQNDWSACVAWGVFLDRVQHPKVMLIEAWHVRLELHALVRKIRETADRRSADAVLVEGKASGLSVVQEIKRLSRDGEFSLIVGDAKGDKVSRLHAVAPMFSGGLVYAPDRKWADMVIDEIAAVPRGKHDDLADAAAAGLSWLRKNNLIRLSAEVERDDYEDRLFTGRRKRLYDV